ncbi:hypothetical protein [Streptomyces avermitilis]|uniref:hypothetical protein n=1 Tax=Streptomyces avermitilis TaxID=33903 RepID=UPI0036C136EA
MVQINAPSPIIDYVSWYTEDYFESLQSPAQALLFVHDLPPNLWRSVRHARLAPPLRRVVLPSASETICLVDDRRRAVHLVPPVGSDQSVLVVRILRGLVLRELLAMRYSFFHAACFALRGTGVALIGVRRAGKTTTLLHSLDHPEAALVSNDKIALIPGTDSDPVVALGFPVQVGIRAGSVLALAEGPLRTFLRGRWSQRFGDIDARSDQETRLQVRPQELAAVVGSVVMPRCRLGLAIEPHLDPHVGKPRLQRLNDAECRALWARHLLPDPAAVFPEQAVVADPAIRTAMRIPRVPTYRLIQPPAAGPPTVRLIEDLMRHTPAGE